GRAYAANNQTADAIAVWRKAADKGSTSAMVELGVLYGTGAGVEGRRGGAKAVRARGGSRQSARGLQPRSARRWRRAIRSRAGARLARKGRRDQRGSAIPARSDAGRGAGRSQGRCRRARSVREGGRAKSRRGPDADGAVHAGRPRRAKGQGGGQGLLRT